MADLLPHDSDAERSIIALAIIRPDKLQVALDSGITSADFYDPKLGAIWLGVAAMCEACEPIDEITLSHHLSRSAPDLCATHNVPALLVDVVAGVPNTNMASYCAVVLDLSYRRKVIRRAAEVSTSAYDRTTVPLMADIESLVNLSPDVAADTYQPWDLAEFYQSATHAAPKPPPAVLGKRLDGERLIVPGQKGLFIAPPESGKSFLCVALAVEAAMSQRHTLYIDYETSAKRMLGRVTSHQDGLLTDGWFTYIRPRLQPFTSVARRRLLKYMEENDPVLIVLDGYNSMLSQNNADPNKPNEVNRMIEKLVNWLVADRCCTIIVDHVPKSTSGPTRGFTATGSVAKTADADWIITLEQDADAPFKRHAIGHASIKVVKDKDGVLRHKANADDVVGRLVVKSHNDGSWQHCIDVPPGKQGPGLPW